MSNAPRVALLNSVLASTSIHRNVVEHSLEEGHCTVINERPAKGPEPLQVRTMASALSHCQDCVLILPALFYWQLPECNPHKCYLCGSGSIMTLNHPDTYLFVQG